MRDEAPSDAWLRHITGWPFLHARPSKLAVAVSGGGDSMACLDLMLWHGAERGFPVEAVTVDHGLRAEAADEIALVAGFCAGKGVPHSVVRWDWEGSGNLQAEARAARYGLIAEWARGRGVDCVALGHTRDDVAETFLMRLARRAGVDGLSGMERTFTRDGVRWIRPMLAHGRGDWRAYLTRHGVPWAEDASNADAAFERVRARKVLAALAPLGIDADVLADVAHNMAMARSALDHVLLETEDRYVEEARGDLILPDEHPESGRMIPHEIMFRLRREAIRWVGGAVYAPRSDAMTELDIAIGRGKTHTLGGCVFTRSKGRRSHGARWRIAREYNAVKDVRGPTDAPWDGRWTIEGPHAPDLDVRALGAAVKDTPWRETGMPRASVMASPAVWRGGELIAAPVAGLENGWRASATGRGTFAEFLLSR